MSGLSNYAGGIDTTLAFFQNVAFTGYYAKAGTSGARRENASYRGRFDYTGDAFGVQLEHIAIGRLFNPEVGYVRRTDFPQELRRPARQPADAHQPTVRRVDLDASMDYIQNAARTFVQNTEQKALLTVEFNNTNQFKFDYRTDYELLPRDFRIASAVVVPRGGYRYHSVNSFRTNRAARLLCRADWRIVRLVLRRHEELDQRQQRVFLAEPVPGVRARYVAQLGEPARTARSRRN